jgi:hypothetical protein
LIYRDDEVVGSTFASSDGSWFFNTPLANSDHIITAVACRQEVCSKSSAPLIIHFSGDLGRCLDTSFRLSNYRYWGVKRGQGIDLNMEQIQGTPPFEILVDWGDERTERFTHNSTKSMKLNGSFDQSGRYNLSLTIADESGCVYTGYVSVDVLEESVRIDWKLAIPLFPVLILMMSWIIRRIQKNQSRRRLSF